MKRSATFIDGLVEWIGEKVIRPLSTRIKDLESRVATLEGEAAQRAYLGVHEDGKEYVRHNCVTRGGNIFICVVDATTARPGESLDWRLAVRAGRDAR